MHNLRRVELPGNAIQNPQNGTGGADNAPYDLPSIRRRNIGAVVFIARLWRNENSVLVFDQNSVVGEARATPNINPAKPWLNHDGSSRGRICPKGLFIVAAGEVDMARVEPSHG